MKKILALFLFAILFIPVCDIPVLSELVSEDYKVYNEYRSSLFELQRETARLYFELEQGKNMQAVYAHMLQITEKTALLIGNCEAASYAAYNGFQGSLRGHLELLSEHGFSEQQKKDLMDLGYTEEDIAEMLISLAYYNDYYHHASRGFTPKQVQWFHSIGLTDAQISEVQTAIKNHYTQIHTLKEEIKNHQTELLHTQILLSISALEILLDQENKSHNRSNRLEKAEIKLFEAIQTISEDQSSLEHVKAFAKQVYMAAEQNIQRGEDQYMVDFFIGLQIHCGAITALNGDFQFGLKEIKSYESVLSQCIWGEKISSSVQDEHAGESKLDTIPVPDYEGEIEESDEDNNVGYITVIVKTWGSSLSDIVHVIANILVPEIAEEVLWWFLKEVFKITATVVKKVLSIAIYIVVAILTAPPVGGSWVDCVVPCMTEDPSGIFAEILEDEDTVANIEAGIFDESLKDCERNGYNAVYGDPIQIVYTIMHAIKVYKSPNNHYFYYRENLSGAWVVEVEILQHERCGRVVRAYKVDCTYMCNGFDCSIYDSWILNDNFILIWSIS